MGNTPIPWSSCMEEADDRGGPGILTDCLAGLADTTIWADRGPIDQNPSKIEPQDEKDARRANAAPTPRRRLAAAAMKSNALALKQSQNWNIFF